VSVDGFQATLICVHEAGVAERPAGTDGAVVSAHDGVDAVAAVDKLDVLFALSRASTAYVYVVPPLRPASDTDVAAVVVQYALLRYTS
jgi:hypothetical protein